MIYYPLALTSRIVERLLSGVVTRNRDTPPGKMSYKDFVWFLISEEDKNTPRRFVHIDAYIHEETIYCCGLRTYIHTYIYLHIVMSLLIAALNIGSEFLIKMEMVSSHYMS